MILIAMAVWICHGLMFAYPVYWTNSWGRLHPAQLVNIFLCFSLSLCSVRWHPWAVFRPDETVWGGRLSSHDTIPLPGWLCGPGLLQYWGEKSCTIYGFTIFNQVNWKKLFIWMKRLIWVITRSRLNMQHFLNWFWGKATEWIETWC